MNYQIVLAGYGGQGIVFLVKLLAKCAYNKGYAFIGTENHGMSQRGGSVRCDIKIGDFSNPTIDKGQADLILGLDENESLRQIAYLNKHGTLITNSSNTFPSLPFKIIKQDLNYKIKKNKLPLSKGNIYLLGIALFSMKDFPFTRNEIEKALHELNSFHANENSKPINKDEI